MKVVSEHPTSSDLMLTTEKAISNQQYLTGRAGS